MAFLICTFQNEKARIKEIAYFVSMNLRNRLPTWARRKILCKRYSTKSRMALESRADSGLNPLITESHGGQNGMRAVSA